MRTHATPTPSSGISSSEPRRGLSTLLQVALLAALLGATAFAIADLIPGSARRLEHAAPGWIAAEVALEMLAIVAYAVLFHGIFSGGSHTLRFARSAQIATGELGAFVVVPTGAGAPALRFWALIRGGMPFRVAMARSVVHMVIFNLPYIAAAVVLGLSVVIGVAPGHASLLVALAPLGVVAVALAGAATLRTYARGRRGQPRTRLQELGLAVMQAVPDGIGALPAAARRPGLLLGALAFWVGDCGVLVVAFHAAGGSASVGVVILAYMLGQLGNTLPLPGGVGGVEPIMLGVMTASGIGLGLGGAAVVLYRLVSLGLQAIFGALAVTALVPALRRRAPVPTPAPVEA